MPQAEEYVIKPVHVSLHHGQSAAADASPALAVVETAPAALAHDHAMPNRAQAGSVLAAIDISPEAHDVLATAREFASSLGRPLLIVHVLHDSNSQPGQYHDPSNGRHMQPLRKVARQKLDELLSNEAERRPETEREEACHTALTEGLPAQRILEVAQREKVKMIVIGSHGRKGISRVLMGSVAEAVARGSHVPVTIVRTAPA